MTVKIYVSRDSEGHEWSPDHEHEVGPITEMVKRLWAAYHHLSSVYCVAANLHQPNADLVIFSERGIGVVEMKHYYGKIAVDQDGNWFAGNMPIKAGSYTNPHRQAQAYAETLRSKLLPLALPTWIKKTPERWDEIKFQIAVCFTNPLADVSQVQSDLLKIRTNKLKPWESSFEVITPDDIVSWTLKLRFGIDQGPDKNFEPLRLTPATMEKALTLVFGATEWSELLSTMPVGQSYGYLAWNSQDGEQKYNLLKDEITIGRSSECDFVVPGHFKHAGKLHCRIIRTIHGVEIEDLGSTNPTYLNNKPISRRTPLRSEQIIALGGPTASEKSFRFTFVLRETAKSITSNTPSTEHVEGASAAQ